MRADKSALPEPVIVVDYDPSWEKTFRALRDGIASALGDLVVIIEHVGSTAVPGLAAKPIIDVDVVVRSPEDVPKAIGRLSIMGYRHQGDLGITGREAFESPTGSPSHHLYLCSSDSEELRRHIAFRDYLRTHPDEARLYSELKKSLSAKHRSDRDAYTEAKTDFVKTTLERAQRTKDPGAG
jgi:GrpB-like predicted nucleotidyltransferase (UPF0157 family)